ncbi:hypothetical protein PF003_g6443 [Phytophthora fragariae]|nr:hypothetical protein PF003_g6443 [Phytophthora fragariae]
MSFSNSPYQADYPKLSMQFFKTLVVVAVVVVMGIAKVADASRGENRGNYNRMSPQK